MILAALIGSTLVLSNNATAQRTLNCVICEQNCEAALQRCAARCTTQACVQQCGQAEGNCLRFCICS